jgi:hypothetical protein
MDIPTLSVSQDIMSELSAARPSVPPAHLEMCSIAFYYSSLIMSFEPYFTNLPQTDQSFIQKQKFDYNDKLSISVFEVLKRFKVKLDLTEAEIIHGLILICRACCGSERRDRLELTHKNGTLILITGMMLGQKYSHEAQIKNETWSEKFGVELLDLNKMEIEFLKGCDFKTLVFPNECVKMILTCSEMLTKFMNSKFIPTINPLRPF